MDKINICDLEVFYRVGVSEEERAKPQRLLVTVSLAHKLDDASASDDLAKTIDYHTVTQRLLRFGEGREWKLIETVAEDIARTIMSVFSATSVSVEVKKFVLPQARYVSVQIARPRR